MSAAEKMPPRAYPKCCCPSMTTARQCVTARYDDDDFGECECGCHDDEDDDRWRDWIAPITPTGDHLNDR